MNDLIKRSVEKIKNLFDYHDSINNLSRDSNGNLICVYTENNQFYAVNHVVGLTVNFLGKNNTVVISETIKFHNSIFNLVNNCSICIKKTNINPMSLCVENWKFDNVNLYIDENFCCRGLKLVLPSKDMYIGRDCTFSYDIDIWGEDGHAIFDREGRCINHDSELYIGNHVWVGCHVRIRKNTFIADDSIIGTSSVVGGIYDKKGSVIAGNPGRVVKTDITWTRSSPHSFE